MSEPVSKFTRIRNIAQLVIRGAQRGTGERLEELRRLREITNKIGREMFVPRQDWQEQLEQAINQRIAELEQAPPNAKLEEAMRMICEICDE